MRLAAFFILLFCGIAHAQTTVPDQLRTPPNLSGQVSNSSGASHLWGATSTPTLGASGTLGSITLGNATSGLGTLQPATGALGTTTWLLPALSGSDTATFNAATQTLTNKTLTSPTINSGTLGGTLGGTAAFSAIQNMNGGFRDCSGHQWIDVTCPAYGAVSDGTTNNAAAINSAITAAGANGMVYFPGSGSGFCAWPTSGSIAITVTNPSVTLLFQSATTILSTCGHDDVLLQLEGDDDQITDGLLACYGSPDDPKFGSYAYTAPSANCLVFGENSTISNCFACILWNTTVHGGFNAIANLGASSVTMWNVYAGFNYGLGIYYTTAGAIADGSSFISTSFFDNNYPPACGGPAVGQTSISARATSHSYAACTVITIQSGTYYVQNLASCTSGSGADPAKKFYRQNMTDGTCTWQLTNPASLDGIVIDTGAHENYLDQVDITGATFNAISMQNSLSGAEPEQFYCHKCSPALGEATSVSLTAGFWAEFDSSEIGTGFASTSNGILTSSNWNSNVNYPGLSITGGFVQGLAYGISLTAGRHTTISGVTISGGSSGGINNDTGYITETGNMLQGGGTGDGITIVGSPGHIVCYGNNTLGSFANIITGSPGTGNCSTSNNF